MTDRSAAARTTLRRRTGLAMLLLATACTTGRAVREAPPQLRVETTAYEAAARVALPAVEPQAFPGLHNVYELSDRIVSGSEPETTAALHRLADMGIRTILSVDGKAPDHETASALGMRYVHVPIRYTGITDDEVHSIVKTFRELDGPFYVHCFHGQHRGPAAAALGRVVLDGVPRDVAIAEMRQWCGTSEKYEGLYAEVAFGDVPTAAATAAYDFDFAPAHQFAGFRQAMVDLTRSWDTIAALSTRDWQPDPSHPDASARNEAAKMADIYAQTLSMDEVASKPDEFRGWLAQSREDSQRLVELLMAHGTGDAAAGETAKSVAKQLKASCTACHRSYRNRR